MNRPMSRPWLALILISTVLSVHAQDGDKCAEPSDKKVLKLLAEAGNAKDPMERHRKLKQSLEADPDCATCLLRTGISAYMRASEAGVSLDPALRYLEKLNGDCPDYHTDLPYYLGVIKYRKGDRKEAYEHFKHFEELPFKGSERQRKSYDRKLAEVQEVMSELAFEMEFYKNSIPFEPKVLRNVSTRDDEYLPMFSPDNELIFFTRKSMYKAKGDIVPREVEQLTQAERKDVNSDFNSGLAMESPFNVGDNYGGVTLSVNNKEMFITVCKPVTSQYKNCDIYRTHFDLKFNPDNAKQEWVWSGLENLGDKINTPGWEAQPSLSSDGKTLYFATIREGSRKTDIYYSTRIGRTEWSEAKPLPSPINTDSDDKAPFMHSDSRTLYFASKGLKGAGGYDIFYTRLKDDGTWTTPKNMGHPINTDQDEHGLIVSADGKTAYFASSRFKGVGKLDIYGFDLPEEARPDEILIVKGRVKNESGKAVKDAKVEIKYMDTKETEIIDVDEQDGGYAAVVHLKTAGDVLVTVKKEDHVFDSRAFTEKDAGKGGVVKADLEVKKIEVGKAYRVNDINYATNKAEITKASTYILENLITFLEENPTIRIAIHGHTDNVGGMEENMTLSKNRASNVMQYLLDRKVAAGRLSFEGFGPTKPIASNDSDEGRAKNRRTEFVIVSR